MNQLSLDSIAQIQGLCVCGFSPREINAITGIHPNTIWRYRRQIKEPLICECGQPLGHRAWCHPRVKRSEARQKFLKRWGKDPLRAEKNLRKLDAQTLRIIFAASEVTCRLCNTNKFSRLMMDDTRICEECRANATALFEKRQHETQYRIRYRAFRKQMAEIGRLIRKAKELIHENDEPITRHSVRGNRQLA